MIIFNFDNLEQFLTQLTHRIGNEVFAHFHWETKFPAEDETNHHVLILQFLGRVDPTVLILYQCQIKMEKKDQKEQIMQTLKETFVKAGNIQLLQGKIQEMFMSLA